MPEYVVTDKMRAIVADTCWRMGVGIGRGVCDGKAVRLDPQDDEAFLARVACAHALRRWGCSWHEIAASLGFKSHSSIGEMLKLPDPLGGVDGDRTETALPGSITPATCVFESKTWSTDTAQPEAKP